MRFLDEAAEEHDEKVWDWRESLVKRTIYTGNNASVSEIEIAIVMIVDVIFYTGKCYFSRVFE